MDDIKRLEADEGKFSGYDYSAESNERAGKRTSTKNFTITTTIIITKYSTKMVEILIYKLSYCWFRNYNHSKSAEEKKLEINLMNIMLEKI